MWERDGSVFINERWGRSKHHLLEVFGGGVVIALKDGRSRTKEDLAAAEDAAWSQFWPISGLSHGLPL